MKWSRVHAEQITPAPHPFPVYAEGLHLHAGLRTPEYDEVGHANKRAPRRLV
jgi:hypothetical protein